MTPAQIMATYFESWQAKDFDRLRSVLADDASFRGPLGSADDADTCIKGLRGMAEILTDITIHKTFVDAPTSSPGSTCTPRSRPRRQQQTGATSRTARSPGSG